MGEKLSFIPKEKTKEAPKADARDGISIDADEGNSPSAMERARNFPKNSPEYWNAVLTSVVEKTLASKTKEINIADVTPEEANAIKFFVNPGKSNSFYTRRGGKSERYTLERDISGKIIRLQSPASVPTSGEIYKKNQNPSEPERPKPNNTDNKKTKESSEDDEKKLALRDIQKSIEKLKYFGLKPNEYALVVEPSKQKLYLIRNEKIMAIYPVSTAKAGLGEKAGSLKTPTGMHRIGTKMGDNIKKGTILGDTEGKSGITKIYTDKTDMPKDYMTSRLLKLTGIENGINAGSKEIATEERSIYIHGTPEEGLIGKPVSHGCIRMLNDDIMALYELIPAGTLIEIQDNSGK